MAHRFLLLTLLLTTGCTSVEHNQLVSPSESRYYEANEFYESQRYYAAIQLYEEFLKSKPKARLAISAKLNLGMSHYYNEDYKSAYDVLKEINIKDENIKKYVAEIVDICKTNAKDEIEAEEEAEIAATSEITDGGEIEITILDAYLDAFGDVVLKGIVNTTATVMIDEKTIKLDANNGFSASASWKKGDSIVITAKDSAGNSGELDYFPDGERPDKPERLRTINITSNSIEIEWDENDENDIKGYRLFYRRKGGSLQEVPDLIEDTQHEVVGFGSGSSNTIEFYLRAVDKMDNESDDSDILEADLL